MPEIRGDDLRADQDQTAHDVVIILWLGIDEDDLAPLARSAGSDGFRLQESGARGFVQRIRGTCRTFSEPVVSFLKRTIMDESLAESVPASRGDAVARLRGRFVRA